MHYRSSDKPLPEIARELGVDGVLQGSIVRDGAYVRIAIQLIDGRTDRHLWTRSYDRDVGNLLALQSEIAQAVAEELEVELNPTERKAGVTLAQGSASKATNHEAYDAYLKGRFYYSKGGSAEYTAIDYYKKAIAGDSTFAKAYAALAEAQLASADSRETVQKAGENARRAVSLDPTLPEAHAALGIARMADWDWSGSEAEFQRALQLDRNSSVTHQWYAQLLRTTVRLDEALREARRAEELDPQSITVRTMVGWVLFSQRRYDEAIEAWNVVLEMEPEFGLAIYNKGLVYWIRGQGPQVVLAARRAGAV
jgi:tetratricopeptide (TPR) repeat protein